MSDFDPQRNIERFLALAYKEFESQINELYSPNTAHDRLIAVRQFCRLLVAGEGPSRHYAPAPPRT